VAAPPAAPAEDLSNRHGLPQSALDSLEKFAADAQPEVAAASAKPVAATPAAPAEPPAVPGAADAADDAELEKQVQSFKTLKEVRTAHKEALKREREWHKQEAVWKTKVAEHETRLKDYNPEAVKAAAAELESARKRTAELDEQVRTLDYTKSTEFHDKYVKPQAKALEAAYADVAELSVTEGDGTVRKATEADFKRLLGLGVQDAGQEAKMKFGEFAAPEIMAHRRAVVALERSKREAVENAGKMAAESQQKRLAEESANAIQFQAKVKMALEASENEYPDLFKPRQGDDEGNKYLEKGREMFQVMERQDIDEDMRLKMVAIVRNRAMAFPRTLYDLSKARTEIGQLKAKLKSFENSLPIEGQGGPAGGIPAEPTNPMEKALMGIEALAKSF
jgi:hypothetical protein